MTNTKFVFLLFFASLALAGCMRFESISLSHSITGEVVRCGPYTVLHYVPYVSVTDLIYNCVADYQNQGYERMPTP